MSMEMEIGSIMKLMYDEYPVTVHTEKIPQDFEVPALYFPAPISFDAPFTSHSYEMDYTLNVRLFHASEPEAFQNAHRIAEKIRRSRKCVPLINSDGSQAIRTNPDGSTTKRVLIVSEVDVRMVESGAVIMGVAQITVNWKSRYSFETPTYQKIMHVYGRFISNDED